MKKFYVSDLLAPLIDAQSVRDMVTEAVMNEIGELIIELPEGTRSKLSPVAQYYGGKCMAYPAVWFFSQYSSIGINDLRERLGESVSTICFSLSTSVADDLVDADECPSEKELMFFYLLLMRCLASDEWQGKEWRKAFSNYVTPLIPMFVNSGARFPAPCSPETISNAEAQAARRIGNFHGLIASQLDLNTSEASPFIALAQRFGDWCARLDDVVDFDDDAKAGRWDTFPIAVAVRERPSLVSVEKLADLYAEIRTSGLREKCLDTLTTELQEIGNSAAKLGATGLSSSLMNAAKKVSGTLLPIMKC
ncbi:hypothetical protein SH528x_003833 [Novipirellula sp. SH528]|uniref:hypothetical protein n=1 Tax=Novipirellula sp. SH528 TaxID=3454466 RepID=UPI003FA0F724